MQFQLPAGQTRLDLIVGDSVRPPVVVMLGGLTQTRARYVFTSSDPNVIRVYANGDSIVAANRGTATLIVTLVGTTIGNNRVNPTSRTADTIQVAAAALTNVISPTTLSFEALGAKQTVVARSIGRNGQAILGSDIQWRSTAPGIVTVVARDDTTAEVTAVANGGPVDIYAVFGGVDSIATSATVSQRLKRYLLTTASTPTLRSINETMAVSARAVDSLNNTIDVAGGAPTPAAPAFVSDNPGNVEIDPASGVMTARGNTADLPVKITATVGGAIQSDTLQVTVRQVAVSLAIQSADTIRLQSVGDKAEDIGVLAPDALGTQVPGSSISWTSVDPTRVQVVGNELATITGQATGTVVVRARADQQIDSVIVVVTNDAAAITLTPKPLELRSIGETQTMTATVTNTAGSPLPGTSVTWTSRDPAIVELQASPGSVIARGTGEAYVVVSTPGGLTDSSRVRVTNAPEIVDIVPADLTLASVGDADSTFAVNFRNALGASLPRTAANWSSHDVTIARGSGGVITAVGPGATWIVAVSPENANRRDSVRVTVTNAATSVAISPDPVPTMTALGATTTLTAVVRNSSGNPISGAPVVWSVVSGSAVTVDATTGVVTAVANGTATVRATSGTASDDVGVTVAQAVSTGQSLVTAGVSSLVADGTSSTSITVRLRDANGNNITTGGATVTLAQSPAIVGLSGVVDNADGTYTATLTAGTTTGSVTISATANGSAVANTAVVSLTAAAASQYMVSVAPTLQPTAGGSVTISARLTDANGNTVAQAGEVVTWSSTGGGSFGAPTSTTNASGIATVTFTTSTSLTQHVVTATTGTRVGSSAPITTQAGAATQVAVTASNSSPVAGSQVAISAQLLDANSNPVAVAGQSVAWTKSNANGSFSSATTVTNGSGVASVTLTTHTVSGTATTVTATSGSVNGTSGTITTVAGAAAQLTMTQAPSASAQSGVPFAVQPVLQLRDAQGNAVLQANVSVTATITAGGGTLGGVALVQTNASGVATFTDLSITGANGGRTLTFSASGVSGATAGVTLGAGQAATIALLEGSGQSATAGSAVTTAPAVIVRDGSSNPVAGVNVTFAVTSGGGTTSPPSGSSVATDASGVARLTSWTLGATAGGNTLTASAAGLTGSPVTFSATGTTGVATQMTTSVGAQTAMVNTPVAIDPSVVVRDANNNPVAGVSVTFTVTGGSGSISSATGSTVVTNASGVAALSSWTLGTVAGANSVDATSAGLPTVTFTATGTAGPATSIGVNAGNGQSAVVGSAVGTAPSVSVRDAYNNPVALTSVTFTVASGGGTTTPASGSTIQTDAAGIAALTSWTLGTAAGSNSVSATAAGLIGNPVTFSATALVAVTSASQSTVLRTGGNNVAANGSAASEITVTLRDQYGNPVAGKTVSLSRTGTSSVISAPAGTVSNALGEVRFVVTNTTIETVTYSATANDPGAIAITQTAQVTFVAGSPFMVATTGTSQNAVIGTNVAAPPAVLVRDAANNPLQGVSVTFSLTANGGGGSINPASPATVVTDAAGVAALTSWTLGSTAGANNNSVTVTAPGVLGSPITFTASGDNPDPELTSVSPSGAVQGQTLTLIFTGTGFIPTSTVSFSGSGITINSTTVNSATQITANITVAASANTGVRNARVSNPAPGGGGSSDRSFTISAPAVPTLTGLAPSSGTRSQTVDVVFTGTGFASGVTTVNVPVGFTVNSVAVNSGTQLTANITIGATAAYGSHNFTVTNTPAGGTSGAQTFVVNYPAPTLASIAPATGTVLQTVDVVFTGSDFIAGVSSVNVGAGMTVNSVTVNSATQLTANITITTAAATGTYNFSVTNAAPGGGTSATQSFTVSNPTPTLTAIAPTSGERLQTVNVVFTGSGFIAGVSTVNVGAGITVNSVTVTSATSLTANLTIADNASLGARDFSVTNAAPGGGTSAAQSFTVENPLPTVASVSPTSGVQGQNDLALVLTGSGFVSGSAVTFTPGTGIAINSTTVDSPTQITVVIDIAAAATLGAHDVTVTNAGPGGGASGAQTFTVNAPPPPTLTGISPTSAERLQTFDLVLTGTNFTSGVSSVDLPAGITLNATTVNSPTQITANVTVTGTAATGANSITVTNTPAGGTSGAQTLTISNPAPTLTAIAPANAERLQTLNVVFTGTGFISGVSSVNAGPNITVNSTTVNSSTSLTANITITGTASVGARDFSITNAAPGGGTSAAQSFTVNNPAPTLSGVNPTSGVQGQTALQLVLTGSGFVSGSSVAFVPSTDITINSTTVDSPTQITVSISIGASAATGARAVSVTNVAPGGGTSGAQTFTVNAPAVPTLSSVSPAAADRLQTLNLVLTGTSFASGVSSVNVPAGITVNSTTVDSPTQITANISVASTATLGANSITVTNSPAGGISGAQTLTISNPVPTVASVSPNPVDGDLLLSTTVPSTTITGTGFLSGETTVDFVSGATVNGTVTVNSATQITVTDIVYPAAGLLGTTVQMRVTNPGRAPVLHTITVNP